MEMHFKKNLAMAESGEHWVSRGFNGDLPADAFSWKIPQKEVNRRKAWCPGQKRRIDGWTLSRPGWTLRGGLSSGALERTRKETQCWTARRVKSSRQHRRYGGEKHCPQWQD